VISARSLNIIKYAINSATKIWLLCLFARLRSQKPLWNDPLFAYSVRRWCTQYKAQRQCIIRNKKGARSREQKSVINRPAWRMRERIKERARVWLQIGPSLYYNAWNTFAYRLSFMGGAHLMHTRSRRQTPSARVISRQHHNLIWNSRNQFAFFIFIITPPSVEIYFSSPRALFVSNIKWKVPVAFSTWCGAISRLNLGAARFARWLLWCISATRADRVRLENSIPSASSAAARPKCVWE